MKNKSGSRIGRVLTRIINIRSWVDWDRMKVFTRYLVNGFRKFFVPQKKGPGESFEAAQKRLKLKDSDLLARQTGLLRLSILMVTIALLLLAYSIYLFTSRGYMGGLVSLVVMFIALVLAFRYHFWYFQIKERKLGCTIQEWFKQGLMGEKNE